MLVNSLSQRYPLPPLAFDWSLLLFAAIVAVIGGLLAGLPSSLMVWRSDVGYALKSGRGQSETAMQGRLTAGFLYGVTPTDAPHFGTRSRHRASASPEHLLIRAPHAPHPRTRRAAPHRTAPHLST